MKKFLATAATAAILTTGAAFGQTEPDQPAEIVWGDLHGNVAAMQETIDTEFATRGIDAEASSLTLDELSQIMLVFSDDSMNADESRQQVERILAGETAN